jgi:formate hydrogenlyase subunit 3/multisubunit Na+/H+ antiporter MnhD subunit
MTWLRSVAGGPTSGTFRRMTDEPLEDRRNDRIEDVKGLLGAPPVLALVSFVLAVLSLAGFGLMNGTTYVVPFLNGQPQQRRLVVGILLGAALALVPVGLGRRSANIQSDLPRASDDPTGFSRL